MGKSIIELNAASILKPITKVKGLSTEPIHDWVAREEPLEIKIIHGPAENRNRMTLAITMRSPGDDYNLIRGFLHTEGIITKKEDVIKISYDLELAPEQQQLNSVLVHLNESLEFEASKFNRHFYTSSSCGICGKTSLEMVKLQTQFFPLREIQPISIPLINRLSLKALTDQVNFQKTGGIHAAALFDIEGNQLTIHEDIGRHNAVDKVIGWAQQNLAFPLSNHILFVSGRAGFELVQKAVMAGITHFISVGAASELAIDLAVEHQMIMIGFLKENHFNIYNGHEKVS